jgi:hypothetical protein
MYNSDIPSRAELPTSAQLIKSTIIAIAAAAVILVTIVLPAEYAIDPTGIGRLLRLTEMGEIKQQLAAEAEADRIKDREAERMRRQQGPQTRRMFLDSLASLLVPAARAGEIRTNEAARIVVAQAAERTDETVITLKPTEGMEYKMELPRGAQVKYAWSVDKGVVNYDMHGTPKAGGKEKSYKAARGVRGDEGVLTAGFDGKHGWFFRNRGKEAVTIKLRTTGPYAEIKRVM